MFILGICSTCGKEFSSYRHGQKFCSRKCKNKHKAMQKTQAQSKRICKWCGNEFLAKGQNNFCSSECNGANRRQKKANSALLKSKNTVVPEIAEKTKDLRLKFGNKNISTWLLSGFTDNLKEAILARDNYRCYICGKESNLHIHHIIPRSEGGPHIPENLVTLCGGCHRSVESGNTSKAIYNCVKRALSQ